MRFQHVAILAPAFQPSFETTLHFASVLVDLGIRVTLVTADALRDRVLEKECEFASWDMAHTTWVMTGFPHREPDDTQRQTGFLRATEKGATRTLIYQVQHAQDGLLQDVPEVWQQMSSLKDELTPDLWVVDQLCHSLVLALYALELPFHSLCIAHPATIPTGESLFGVPNPWPAHVPPHPGRAKQLTELSEQLKHHLNQKAADLLKEFAPHRPAPDRFTSLCGSEVIFNYPQFDDSHAKRLGKPCYFLGACFASSENLDPVWQEHLERHAKQKKFVVSMGHILNARNDVLARILLAVRRHYPDAAIYVASGASDRGLTHFRSENVVIAETLPLADLLPHTDLAIFHGGVNTFAEALYFGVPMITMPLSFDQYAIARDGEDLKLALALDPNHFDAIEIANAIAKQLEGNHQKAIQVWSEKLQAQPVRAVIEAWAKGASSDQSS
jgi:hypothetical protein